MLRWSRPAATRPVVHPGCRSVSGGSPLPPARRSRSSSGARDLPHGGCCVCCARTAGAIVLLHGAGSTRSDVLDQAAVLAHYGFGVLMIDARGHGDSGGRAMDFGWHGDADSAAATGYLRLTPRRVAVGRRASAAHGLLADHGWRCSRRRSRCHSPTGPTAQHASTRLEAIGATRLPLVQSATEVHPRSQPSGSSWMISR